MYQIRRNGFGHPTNRTRATQPKELDVTRRLTILSIVVAILATLTSCGGGGHDSTNKTTTTTKAVVTTQRLGVPTENAEQVPPTTTPIVEGEIFTQKIVAWGEKATNKSGIFTLQARGEEPGDLENTITLVYDLCATQDTPLVDEGYDEILDVVEVPSDGLFNLNNTTEDDSSLLYDHDALLSIDDSVTVVEDIVEYEGAETTHLTSVIKKGQCTSVRLQIYQKDRGRLIVGFAYTTIPFGEWRPNGDFSHTVEGQVASSFDWEYWNN